MGHCELKVLSQRQLAENIGVSSSAISQYESTSCFNSEPNIKNLIQLAKVLNVSIEWLTTGRGIKEIDAFLLSEKSTYKDVPDNQLSLSRSKQITLKNWQRPTKK